MSCASDIAGIRLYDTHHYISSCSHGISTPLKLVLNPYLYFLRYSLFDTKSTKNEIKTATIGHIYVFFDKMFACKLCELHQRSQITSGHLDHLSKGVLTYSQLNEC